MKLRKAANPPTWVARTRRCLSFLLDLWSTVHWDSHCYLSLLFFLQLNFSSLFVLLQSPLAKTAISTELQLIGWHASISVHVLSHLSQPHRQQTDPLVRPREVNSWKGPTLAVSHRVMIVRSFFPKCLSTATTPHTWLLSRHWASAFIIGLVVFLSTLLNWSLVCRTQILEADLAESLGRDVVVRKGARSPLSFLGR